MTRIFSTLIFRIATTCVVIFSLILISYAQQLSFTEVAQQLGIAHIDYASGAATWGDYDSDGDIDLYVTSAAFSITGPQNLNRLFRNDINISGVFVDIAQQMGVAEIYPGSWGSAWCDFDANGLLDLYVCNNSYTYPDSTKLFINKINYFEDQAGIYRVNNWGFNIMDVWGDYDGDGDQDLYLCVSNYPGHINKLYRNDGIYFTDVTVFYSVFGGTNTQSANWVDYDNDGDLDLYLSNVAFENMLYENKITENDLFINVAPNYGLNDSGRSGGSIWFDYDNDGDLDLFIVNRIDQNFPHLYPGCKLYRNDININNKFMEVSNSLGIGDTISADGCTVGDYDMDGDLDLYLAVRGGRNKYFRNDVNITGIFSEIGNQLNVSDTLNTLGALNGDYDNDGDLDIYAVNFHREICRLYRNNINTNNYLKIRLLDKIDHFDRQGSLVKVYLANTDSLIGMRVVDGGGSGGITQDEYDCHFGLDPNLAYDIEVIFTTRTNGQNHIFNKQNRTELGGVVPSQVGNFMEIRDTVVTVLGIKPGERPKTINHFKLYQNYPNPFNSTTTIPFQIETGYDVKLIIYDLTGKEVITLVNKYYNRGFYEINWNGKNKEGGDIASGVYICNFLLNNKLQDVRKLFLVR
ncbi:MAG TPA: T9SS type A sorting domain-containing protein [Caldithrix sp.]|nr:T9SS type A sorting domain-containing protein [Caldithrix sp.]